MSDHSCCQGAQRRRTPRQPRGQATLDALVSATATLIDEVGYETLTTKAIAARAGVSIGSFYQFFPNKDAAIGDLVQRYRGQVRTFLNGAIGAPEGFGISSAWISQIIAGLAEIYRNMPGFRGVWSGRQRTGPLGDQAHTLRQEVFDVLDAALADAYPGVAIDSRRRCLGIALETAYLLLSNIDDKRLVFEELQRMLAPYLASYFAPVMPVERTGR